MPSKKRIVLEYKYPETPWVLYDWTQVQKWADTQEQRMHLEKPGAKFRRRTVV